MLSKCTENFNLHVLTPLMKKVGGEGEVFEEHLHSLFYGSLIIKTCFVSAQLHCPVCNYGDISVEFEQQWRENSYSICAGYFGSLEVVHSARIP